MLVSNDPLSAYLLPGEELITNELKKSDYGADGYELSAYELAAAMNESSEEWEDVRVIEDAFDIEGNLLSDMASVVGKRKKT